jgi:hypothetical protein
MLYAIIANTEEDQTIQFIKGNKEHVLEAFEENLIGLKAAGDPFSVMLVDEDEMTQATLVATAGGGLTFDSTVIFVRYADNVLGLDETDYVVHT